MKHAVIRDLYPAVHAILESAEGTQILDAHGNKVAVDDALVQAGIAAREAAAAAVEYKRQRAKEYPPIEDYIDGVVKGDAAQVQAYVDACLAVKAKYPKPDEAAA